MISAKGRRVVSSVDLLLDFIESNTIIGSRASAKGVTIEAEETKIVRAIAAPFFDTLQRLVDEGKIRRIGLHKYRLVLKK
ncbi:hypothetical protein HY546_02545 [archaeon]|nr:hypothetical protein [archaeon]